MSVDISLRLGKIKLENPLILTPGPLSASGKQIIKAVKDGGFGAVITKTLCFPASGDMQSTPFIAKLPHALLNSELWADLSFKEWVDVEFKVAKEAGVPIIASIAPLTDKPLEEIEKLARGVYEAGADIIELPPPCPITEGAGVPAGIGELVAEAVKVVRSVADVPIIGKVSGRDIRFLDIVALSKAIEKAGATAVSTTDAIGPSYAFDIETGKPRLGMPGYGGLSGPALKPFALGCVVDVARAVKVPVIGIGGVENGIDAIEMILAGAGGVGICSGALIHGRKVGKQIINDIISYMERKGYSSIKDFVGLGLRELFDLKARESKAPTRLVANVDPSGCTQCTTFMNYLFKELRFKDLCRGCGMCAAICPTNSIRMEQGVAVSHRGCTQCGLCVTVCPMNDLKYPLNTTLNQALATESISLNLVTETELGQYIRGGAYLVRAKDEEIRVCAQDGGTTTALLKFGLDLGLLEATIVTDRDAEWNPTSVIIANSNFLPKYQGANFIVNPQLSILRKLREWRWVRPQSVATVTLPCQTAALRKAQYSGKLQDLTSKIGLTIGLFCSGVFKQSIINNVIKRHGINPSEVEKFKIEESKEGDSLSIYIKNGTVKKVPCSLIEKHLNPACLLCLDYANELADISIGSSTNKSGWNLLLIRTLQGARYFKKALDNNYIELSSTTPDLDELRGRALKKHNRTFSTLRRQETLCEEICPWSAINKVREIVTVDHNKCHGCSLCTYYCPQKAISMVPRPR